ncbi:hypothetical protein C8R45DRAFT_1037407, partial [Mycena sanguinolenta]
FSRLELLDTNHIQDDNASALTWARSSDLARMRALTRGDNTSSIRVLCDVLMPFGDGSSSFHPSFFNFLSASGLSARVGLVLGVSFLGSLPLCLEKARLLSRYALLNKCKTDSCYFTSQRPPVFGENFTSTLSVKEEELRGAGSEAGETEGEKAEKLREEEEWKEEKGTRRVKLVHHLVPLKRKMIMDGVSREILLVLYRRYSFEF